MRITFDFDNALRIGNVLDILRADTFLKRFAYKKEYYVSAGKRGIHCVYWLKRGSKILKLRKIGIRYLLNDDFKRILLDILRAQVGDVTEVLWDQKGHKKNRKFNNLWDCFKYIEKERDKKWLKKKKRKSQ